MQLHICKFCSGKRGKNNKGKYSRARPSLAVQYSRYYIVYSNRGKCISLENFHKASFPMPHFSEMHWRNSVDFLRLTGIASDTRQITVIAQITTKLSDADVSRGCLLVIHLEYLWTAAWEILEGRVDGSYVMGPLAIGVVLMIIRLRPTKWK